MKVLLTSAVLLALCANAAAKLAPFDPEPQRSTMTDDALYLGPIGAMMESDYFNVPRARAGDSRVFPCRPRLQAQSHSTQIVQTCE
jgi:hypothetical protein